MNQHHRLSTLLLATALSWSMASPVPAHAETPTEDLPTRLNELGSENGASARLAGTWEVTETVWSSPTAAPIELRNEIATRRMIGSMLEETIRSANGTILRVDDLLYNRVEGRWQYMSMDTRAAVGIMTAQSYDRGSPDRLDLAFQPFSIPGSSAAVPGSGSGGVGQMLRMRQEIMRPDAGHDVKNQYFALADGTGSSWLAHRYTYRRLSTGTP